MSALAQTIEDNRLLQALARRLQKTDRINARKYDLDVKVTPANLLGFRFGTVPGFTDSQTITLNATVLGLTGVDSFTTSQIALALAVNYHELAHVIYTPDVRGAFVSRVREKGLFTAFNALEDQRAESLFVASHGSVGPLFTMATARLLAEHDRQKASNYALVYGRKFLPAYIVRFFREHARYTDNTCAELEEIIDSYLLINPVRKQKEAIKLLERFKYLIGGVHNLPDGNHHDTDTGNITTPPNPQKDSDSAMRSDEDAEALKDQMEKGFDESGDDSENADGGSSSPDGGDDVDSDEAGSSAGGGGSLEDGEGTPEPKSTGEIVNRTERDAMQDSEVRREVDALKNFVHDKTPFESQLPKYESTNYLPVTADMQNDINRIVSKLNETLFNAERTLNRNVRHGFVNPLDFQRSDPWDFDVFSDWTGGRDGEAGNIKFGLVVDNSGSMAANYLADKAARVTHVLTQAISEIEDSSSFSLLFANTASAFVDSSSIARDRYLVPRARGGTNPAPALMDAVGQLLTDACLTRVLVIITDGEWPGAGSSEAIIREAREAGIVTCLFGLSGAVAVHGSHDCELAMDVDSPEKVVAFVEELVTQHLKNAVSNRL